MTPQHPPLLIAGPCSAESFEQLHEVAIALRGCVSLLRCGVWKPRTRPGGFEGMGEQALGWMQQLQTQLGVRFCCEVARPEQVALALRYGINTLWIGARTTANPFLVSELCEALRGADVQVMVKNPICPDVSLWLGALERVEQAGAKHLVAIHRGFSLYHNQGYRNAPLWEVPLELRRLRPDMPVVCDPSHIGGQRSLVEPLCETARQLAYDGLMIEVHPHPDQALTDSKQQLTPAQLIPILEPWLRSTVDTLPSAATAGTGASTSVRLNELRGLIDDCDRQMLTQLARRMAIADEIATVKHAADLPVYQPSRWREVVQDRLQVADSLGLGRRFVEDLMEKIHAESVRIQLASSHTTSEYYSSAALLSAGEDEPHLNERHDAL